jgi:hypothetical protein
MPSPATVAADAWDVWWACTRAGLSAEDLGLSLRLNLGLDVEPDTRPGDLVVVANCGRCVVDVAELTRQVPADTIDPDTWPRCGCPAQWARRMCETTWLPSVPEPPPWRVSIAVVKPTADVAAVRRVLGRWFEILTAGERWLSEHDVHRLYPDAYGPDFRRRQNDYLTLEPAHVLVLVAPARLTVQQHRAAKMEVRLQLGGNDLLRNHVHMADNPGEAWCDALHMVGPTGAQQLYERYRA